MWIHPLRTGKPMQMPLADFPVLRHDGGIGRALFTACLSSQADG
jgi:hypothetical protein